mmetsp:Transcript_11260/g.17123  ORF Transcript_11260/g.17123 Transcript_11260/m.17123 type:complete len:108 (-) Transcript_11260:620-943(-)
MPLYEWQKQQRGRALCHLSTLTLYKLPPQKTLLLRRDMEHSFAQQHRYLRQVNIKRSPNVPKRIYTSSIFFDFDFDLDLDLERPLLLLDLDLLFFFFLSSFSCLPPT